ncbi:MAG TPA: universal stress protein [Kofleriaceae bacterium]|jgi:nucleotide-binding universal stress UspA family protein
MPILCGSDLSAASAGVLEVACALATMRKETEVILLHVADLDEDDADRDQQLSDRRIKLDAQAAHAHFPGGRIRVELLVGKVEEALVDFSDTESVSMIVIARASRGTGRVGTTATTIIAHTRVPVLCVHAPEPWLAFAKKERPLRVLLGIDDSSTCDLSMQFAQGLRAEGPLDIILGGIYYPDDASKHYGVKADNIIDRLPEVEGLLARDLVRRFGGDPTHVAARPRRGLGRIGDHLLELARDEKVDAIVVGTGQKTGLGRLGSVSTVIALEAPQSVICVPPQANVPTITVPSVRATLVATDLSQFANRAVSYAFSITPPDGTVHIVNVVDDDKELSAGELAELERQLAALAPVNAAQTVLAHVVRGDDAADALAQAAARNGVDVICISSRGRSGITRAIVGSVADRLLRATRLPVLVLRPS